MFIDTFVGLNEFKGSNGFKTESRLSLGIIIFELEKEIRSMQTLNWGSN